MPIYIYKYVDENDNVYGEEMEFLQRMSDSPYETHPENGKKIRKVITSPSVIDSGRPAWETSYQVRDYLRTVKPKFVSDKKAGIKRERYDPNKHC